MQVLEGIVYIMLFKFNKLHVMSISIIVNAIIMTCLNSGKQN